MKAVFWGSRANVLFVGVAVGLCVELGVDFVVAIVFEAVAVIPTEGSMN